jgi:hypothetical protein
MPARKKKCTHVKPKGERKKKTSISSLKVYQLNKYNDFSDQSIF